MYLYNTKLNEMTYDRQDKLLTFRQFTYVNDKDWHQQHTYANNNNKILNAIKIKLSTI